MSEEEDWEYEYPEGSLGWKINRKLDAIEEHALKSGAVFTLLFIAFFTPAAIEIASYSSTFPPSSPFFNWLRSVGNSLVLAQWYTTVYSVVLLLSAATFLYCAVRLLWRGLKQRSKGE